MKTYIVSDINKTNYKPNRSATKYVVHKVHKMILAYSKALKN